ncbi:hypothetical protein CFC21_028859, partial [Triticum aestivum]
CPRHRRGQMWRRIVNGVREEVARRCGEAGGSGAVSPGCGGGVYARRSRSGRRDGIHRKYWLLSKKGKFANVKKLFIGRKVVTCLLFVS